MFPQILTKIYDNTAFFNLNKPFKLSTLASSEKLVMSGENFLRKTHYVIPKNHDSRLTEIKKQVRDELMKHKNYAIVFCDKKAEAYAIGEDPQAVSFKLTAQRSEKDKTIFITTVFSTKESLTDKAAPSKPTLVVDEEVLLVPLSLEETDA